VSRLAFDRSRALRNRAMRERQDEAAQWQARSDLPEASEAGRRRRFERMVATLPEIQRARSLTTMRTIRLNGCGNFGLNVNTVKTHLRRARGVLRERGPEAGRGMIRARLGRFVRHSRIPCEQFRLARRRSSPAGLLGERDASQCEVRGEAGGSGRSAGRIRPAGLLENDGARRSEPCATMSRAG
jgi:hypothetical protein